MIRPMFLYFLQDSLESYRKEREEKGRDPRVVQQTDELSPECLLTLRSGALPSCSRKRLNYSAGARRSVSQLAKRIQRRPV